VPPEPFGTAATELTSTSSRPLLALNHVTPSSVDLMTPHGLPPANRLTPCEPCRFVAKSSAQPMWLAFVSVQVPPRFVERSMSTSVPASTVPLGGTSSAWTRE